MIEKLTVWFHRMWCSMNFRFCMTQAYLASQRGENVVSGDWQTLADEWYLQWWKVGRSL